MERKWHLETWPSLRPMSLRFMMKCTEKLIINGEPDGGFKCFLFSPLLGEMIQFDSYFLDGLEPPPRFF